MGRRGPAPTPSNIVQLEGNRGHRKKNRGESRPRPVPPECPPWLDARAKSVWKKLEPELDRLGLLTIVDGDSFAVYCSLVSENEWAVRILAKEGRTFTTDKGYVGQHPAVAIFHNSARGIKAFAAEFGLTPSARSRLSVPEQKDDAGLRDLLD